MPGLVDHSDSRAGTAAGGFDYQAARDLFTWEAARGQLDGLPGGGLNITHEAVDRHVLGGRGEHVALRFVSKDDHHRDVTYRQLGEQVARFADVLDSLGVPPGATVFSLLGRVPDLYVAALGTLKHGSVFSPLFSAFGPEPIRQRMALGDGMVLVTSSVLYRRKVAPIRHLLPSLEHVLLTDVLQHQCPDGTGELAQLLAGARTDAKTASTRPDDVALLHFTSGTTGTPKAAVHVHEAVVTHHATGTTALGLRPDDRYWCTADPGWVTGTSYGIISPLTHGLTVVADEGDFDAERWYRTLQDERVTVWYTAPTALRMLMRAGDDLPASFDLAALRVIASVGEPLSPDIVQWTAEVLGRPAHDNWWQTETGGIMIANIPGTPVRPGSMGRPLPGVDAALLARRPDGELDLDVAGLPVVVDDAGTTGELALRPGWPSMFRGYLGEDERYQRCFVGGWYLSGDLARRDADGWFWFVGRRDDVIKSAGHLIGPFEVERALLEHPAVDEVGVIGVPDPIAGQLVRAVVSLAAGVTPSEEVATELLGFARARLGPAVAPRSIAFDQQLPKTRSGKIARRVLRARQLGLDEGDTSTLEGSS